ncbi:MAG: hypothetical protein QNJ97_07100 [Myxococcota bacterium]|nr:hypothetical protein [Myxococcota bacterium]
MTASRSYINQIGELVVENGYEIVSQQENTVQIRDLESDILITLALEDDVLFNTISCETLPADAITPALMHTLLSAENGISTSSFQLYHLDSGKVAVTLNNFCKLQAMGADDEDDILSCLDFLLVDTVAARALLER